MGASTWLIQKYGFLLIQNQRTLKPGFLGRIRDRHQHLLHPGRLTKMEPLVAIGRTVGWTYSQRGWKVGRTCSAIFLYWTSLTQIRPTFRANSIAPCLEKFLVLVQGSPCSALMCQNTLASIRITKQDYKLALVIFVTYLVYPTHLYEPGMAAHILLLSW